MVNVHNHPTRDNLAVLPSVGDLTTSSRLNEVGKVFAPGYAQTNLIKMET